MKSVFNLICKLEFIAIDQVTKLLSTNESIILEYTGTKMDLPISKSSVRYTCERDRSAAGTSYNINFASRLKTSIPDPEPGIYLMTVNDGNIYVIGTKDYPVKYSSSENLTEQSFNFSYKSLSKPLKLQV